MLYYNVIVIFVTPIPTEKRLMPLPKFDSGKIRNGLLAIASLFMFAQLHNTVYAAESEPDALEHESIPCSSQFYPESVKDLSIPSAITVEYRWRAHEVEYYRSYTFERRTVKSDHYRIRGPPHLLI